MNTHLVKHYVKLLSVSLFQVMEENEVVFRHDTDTMSNRNMSNRNALPHPLVTQTRQIQKWLALLPLIDSSLPEDVFVALMQKSKAITSPNAETMLNATALTLMLLDDHYRIFSLEMPKPVSTLIPLMQLQDIKPDIGFSKPTLV